MLIFKMMIQVLHHSIEEKNTIIIKMFTAEWCPPCQRTKKFLGNGGAITESSIKSILNKIFGNTNFKHTLLFQNLSHLSDDKKIKLFSKGVDFLRALENKQTDGISIEVLNLINIIKKNTSSIDLSFPDFDSINSLEIVYLGAIKQIFEAKIVFCFLDVDNDSNESEIIKYGIRSMPTFVSIYNQKTIMSGGFSDENGLYNILKEVLFEYISQ